MDEEMRDLITPPEEEPIDPGMQTFGQLGYVTLDEANQYIAENYMSTETLRISWEALDPADRATLLRRSFQVIELLPLTGHKTSPSQLTAFPRCPDAEVPDNVKFAQIEQALIGADTDSAEEARQYERMWQWGVSHYRIGNLTESISTGAYGTGVLRAAGVTSPAASRLLAPYIRGGFSIQ